MKKVWSRGRFPVEVIKDAVAKSELARKLKAKVKERLARVEPKRLRRWCLGVMAAMLVWFVLLFAWTGVRCVTGPHYSAISPILTAGGHRVPVKAFATMWDSLMADPAMKLAWDSLLKMRPGLKDTVGKLQRADSEMLRK